MKKIKILPYNLVIGVLVGFVVGQIVVAEGYGLVAIDVQRYGESNIDVNIIKIIAFLMFIVTVGIFYKLKINFNKLSVYLIATTIISLIVTVEGFLILGAIVIRSFPNIVHKIAESYIFSVNIVILSCIVVLGLFLSTFIFMVNIKVKYLKHITKEVKEFKTKGFGRVIKVKGGDEISELCKSINDMSIELGERIKREKVEEKRKYELITNLSHDLKTPLTSLVGYLELLNTKEVDNEEKNKYISITYNKSLRLKELVNELFNYTKLTSKDVMMKKEKVNISNIINGIIGESILSFSEKNIEVILDNPYKELFLVVDINLFKRLIENVIKNAEKYSDCNSTFKVRVQKEKNVIKIYLRNLCENIKEEEVSNIFERFYRVDKSRSGENEGSGLGLSISKRIVELHNGTIIANKYGNEIEFEITFSHNENVG